MLLGNLFRDQLDRYGELETIADRWAAVVAAAAPASCSTPTTRWSPTSGRGARRRRTSASTTTRSRCPSSSTRRTPSTAAAAATPTPTTAVYLAHLGHYRCPNCGQERPEPTVVATDVELRGIRSAAFTLRGAAGRAPAPRPLQRLQRARRRRADARRSGVAARRRRRRPASASRPRSAARRRSTSARPTSILLVKNPAGANEVLRTLALEGGELDLLGVLNDRIADGRDVSWVWDADWELLVPQRAADDVLRHARGRAGAADEVRRAATGAHPRRRRRSSAALDAALATAKARSTSSPPTRRCSSCASC